MSEDQLMRISTALKNRIKSITRGSPDLMLAINRAIDTGLEGFLAREVLESYEAVDVEQLASDLDLSLDRFNELLNELTSITTIYGKMAYSKETFKTVTVRTSGRIVLSEFIEGTVFRKRHLLRKDGSIGGVELVAIQ